MYCDLNPVINPWHNKNGKCLIGYKIQAYVGLDFRHINMSGIQATLQTQTKHCTVRNLILLQGKANEIQEKD